MIVFKTKAYFTIWMCISLSGCTILYDPDSLRVQGDAAPVDGSIVDSSTVDGALDGSLEDAAPMDANVPDVAPPDVGFGDAAIGDAAIDAPDATPDAGIVERQPVGRRGTRDIRTIDITTVRGNPVIVYDTILRFDGDGDGADDLHDIVRFEPLETETLLSPSTSSEVSHPRISVDGEVIAYQTANGADVRGPRGARNLPCPLGCGSLPNLIELPSGTSLFIVDNDGQLRVIDPAPETDDVTISGLGIEALWIGSSAGFAYRVAPNHLRVAQYDGAGVRSAGVGTGLGAFHLGTGPEDFSTFAFTNLEGTYVRQPSGQTRIGNPGQVLDAVNHAGQVVVLYRQNSSELWLIVLGGDGAVRPVVITEMLRSGTHDVAALSPDGTHFAYVEQDGTAWWDTVTRWSD